MRKISQKSCTNILIILFVISLGSFVFFYLDQNKYIHPALKVTPQEGNKIQTPISPVEEKSNPPRPLGTKSTPQEGNKIQTDTITLIAGDINTKLEILPGQTLYEILLAENNKKLVTFKGKEYTGMGFFVTDIGNLHEERGKYLMYYINSVEASSGISVYIPKSGDVVEWKLN